MHERHDSRLLETKAFMCARRFPKTTKAASLDSYGRFAGGPAGMAITPKPRDSASPSFDGFALSSDSVFVVYRVVTVLAMLSLLRVLWLPERNSCSTSA